VRVLENRFTWSKSRAETFEHCLRKYWWTYYGAWGGWSADAPAAAREAYVLKNLHSRWTWVGHVVHAAIERILRRLSRPADPGDLALGDARSVDAAEEVAAVTTTMRAQFRESREGRYRADPKRYVGLMEHEYAEILPDAEWKEMNRRAVDGVSRFLASDVFARIRATDPRTWFPIEALDSFDVDGTPVWVALDFALRTPEGAEVFDWKTGGERVEENRLQLVCYAAYLNEKHGVPLERVTCHLVYVNTGAVHDWRPTQADLRAARETIRHSVAEMRRRLREGGGNEADMLAFPMTEIVSRCAACAFRRLCGRQTPPPGTG
jgi:hypothetical protein